MNTDAYYFINMNVFSLIHNTVMQDSQSAGKYLGKYLGLTYLELELNFHVYNIKLHVQL